MSLSSKFGPLISQINSNYKLVLLSEIILGGVVIFKVAGFVRFTAERYRLQAITNQKREEKVKILT